MLGSDVGDEKAAVAVDDFQVSVKDVDCLALAAVNVQRRAGMPGYHSLDESESPGGLLARHLDDLLS